MTVIPKDIWKLLATFVESPCDKVKLMRCNKKLHKLLQASNEIKVWNTYDLDKGMRKAALLGHKRLIDYYISKGACCFGRALYNAARGAHQEIMDSLLHKTSSGWAMEGAARGKHKFLIKSLMQVSANFNWGLEGAARGGHKDLVTFFVSKGACHWSWGYRGAVLGGDKELVKFFISKGGGSDHNTGLNYASHKGHSDLVKFFISKGANHFAMPLYYVACRQNKELFELLISKGAKIDDGLVYAHQNQNFIAIDFFQKMKK